MRIHGKPGARTNTCKPRKRTSPTKAERRLEARQNGYSLSMQRKTHKPMGPEMNGYRKPGSLQLS